MATVDLADPAARAFVAARHLATLSTLRPDGSPHVVPVGYTWDGTVARVITSGDSVKARNVQRDGQAVICQVDGGTWLSIEGRAEIDDAPEHVALAERLYTERYRRPRANPRRVVIVVHPQRVLGRV